MIKAVIFDLDGVIIDSEPLHIKALQKTVALHGKNIDHSYISRFIGVHDKQFFENVKHDFNLQPTVEDFIKQRDNILFELMREKLKLFHGFRTFLTMVKGKNMKLAITTSSSRFYTQFVLEKFNLKHNFPVLVCGDDVQHPKPHPEPYQKTIEQLQLQPEECIVIEDSIAGLTSAKAAGTHTIAVTNSFTASNLSEADLVVNNLTEINGNIITLFGVM
ncbi:HAD family phosphatase [Candidatus Woesearchaeota archaeon]|nr:HAD family phosphatase [Candidatus Woesearchaeota archaeon]